MLAIVWYGVSLTPLQLAQAYAVLGAGGLYRPVSLQKVDQPPIARRVIQENTALELLRMMETVVSAEGTGLKAAVSGYRVAGKTGTTRKFAPGGYSKDRYTAVFAGVAPVSNPRLAVAVVVDEPTQGGYYGGDIAAPVFAGQRGRARGPDDQRAARCLSSPCPELLPQAGRHADQRNQWDHASHQTCGEDVWSHAGPRFRPPCL